MGPTNRPWQDRSPKCMKTNVQKSNIAEYFRFVNSVLAFLALVVNGIAVQFCLIGYRRKHGYNLWNRADILFLVEVKTTSGLSRHLDFTQCLSKVVLFNIRPLLSATPVETYVLCLKINRYPVPVSTLKLYNYFQFGRDRDTILVNPIWRRHVHYVVVCFFVEYVNS